MVKNDKVQPEKEVIEMFIEEKLSIIEEYLHLIEEKDLTPEEAENIIYEGYSIYQRYRIELYRIQKALENNNLYNDEIIIKLYEIGTLVDKDIDINSIQEDIKRNIIDMDLELGIDIHLYSGLDPYLNYHLRDEDVLKKSF